MFVTLKNKKTKKQLHYPVLEVFFWGKKCFFLKIQLIYNIILVSGVQHSYLIKMFLLIAINISLSIV